MRDLIIAVGQRANSLKWINKKATWEQLCDKLSKTIYTSETVEEYKRFIKEQKQEAKDHGGFVGGKLSGPKRQKNNVEFRSMVTLDLDDAELGFIDKFKRDFEYTCCLYSTHGHRPDAPRYRIIIPLSRDVEGDEYVAISRLIADSLGIEQVDPVSFTTNQLMYWPSTPSDGVFIYEIIDKNLLNPDSFLAKYPNWKDLTTLPKKVNETHINSGKPGRKQADPLEKDGIVGTFCRTYSISEAIDKFLGDIYEDVGGNRYKYIPSSSVAGAINYDDKFFYSHHANDPAVGQTLNAFNLIRIHLFGDDKDSFKKMKHFAMEDVEVKKLLVKESLEQAKAEFDDDDLDWMITLSRDQFGKIENKVSNLVKILEHDEAFKNIAFNVLASTAEVTGPVPWNRVGDTKFWRDGDTDQMKIYIETKYNCTFSDRNHEMAFTKLVEDRAFNPVKQYLESLPKWDGVKRVESLFIKSLDADDNDYTREVTRKWFAAAVARIYEPGIKFDNIIVLDGEQGVGKSTIIKSLVNKDFFTDSLQLSDMDDTKKAGEKVQGFWVIEIQELAGMKKADIEKVKAFISSTDDRYRASYGHHVEWHPRQCIIFATVNGKYGYLRDLTGNRRFWVIKINSKNVFPDFNFSKEFKDQLWAEAKYYYEHGEKLYLGGEYLETAKEYQNNAMEHDERAGAVEDFLNMEIPANWYESDSESRKWYITGDKDDLYPPFKFDNLNLMKRDKVCGIEIWIECFGKELGDYDRKAMNEMAMIMSQIPGWEKADGKITINPYGRQRYYIRKKN